MSSLVYVGVRRPNRPEVMRCSRYGNTPLPSVVEPSPLSPEYAWGQVCQGARALAVDLLADALGQYDLAVDAAPFFAELCVARFGNPWRMTADEIVYWYTHAVRYTFRPCTGCGEGR